MAGRNKTGTFLGLPYDWRRPTPERLKRGIWDPEGRRVLVPKAYGWGYGINLTRGGPPTTSGEASPVRGVEPPRTPFPLPRVNSR